MGKPSVKVLRKRLSFADHRGQFGLSSQWRFVGTYLGNREYFRIAPWLPGIGTTCQRRSLGPHEGPKLHKRKSLVLAGTLSRIAGSGSMRAIFDCPDHR